LFELLERHGSVLFGAGPVLVPGCGLGHDVRALAAAGLTAHGLDISETAVGKARAIPAVGGEIYETGDFLSPEWSAEREFSAVWEHTCFCAIDPSMRAQYAESTAAVLSAGGILAGVFYLTPNDPGEEDDGPPFNATTAEIDALFARFFERIDAWVPQNTYPGREGKEWTAVFRKLPNARVAE
jgi:hypothetical protein